MTAGDTVLVAVPVYCEPGPYVLVHCIPLSIRFLHNVFTEHAGNGYLHHRYTSQLTGTLFIVHQSSADETENTAS